MPTTFDVKIYFDTICPWCYVGHTSLAKAIALYQKTYPGGSRDRFNFILLPFYLKPDAPETGVPWAERVAEKNGEERVNAIRTRLQRTGRENGIAFRFDSRVGNTRDSHRLIYSVSGRPELQRAVLEAVYYAHFEADADITSHADLTKAALAAGMEEVEVKDVLEGEAYGEKVDALAARAREVEGVKHVPTFVIGGRFVEGAEEVGELYQTLVEVREGTADTGGVV